mmetsp:Transcript_48229/g.134605  ORF Transcript_48229/g.134605 Transcript_48229/m.134605 type:complete len:206 (+) Transcript_48229:621-1238(+)
MRPAPTKRPAATAAPRATPACCAQARSPAFPRPRPVLHRSFARISKTLRFAPFPSQRWEPMGRHHLRFPRPRPVGRRVPDPAAEARCVSGMACWPKAGRHFSSRSPPWMRQLYSSPRSSLPPPPKHLCFGPRGCRATYMLSRLARPPGTPEPAPQRAAAHPMAPKTLSLWRAVNDPCWKRRHGHGRRSWRLLAAGRCERTRQQSH